MFDKLKTVFPVIVWDVAATAAICEIPITEAAAAVDDCLLDVEIFLTVLFWMVSPLRLT